MTLSAQDRARRIKIILFDVDGVLTDGGIWLFPGVSPSTQGRLAEKDGQTGFAIQSATMVEAKGFNAHDGTAISLARLGGLKCGNRHQAHQRDGGPARPRPEARIRLPGLCLQDESAARDYCQGRRDPGRDRLRGRRRDRPAGDAGVRLRGSRGRCARGA